jgi:hypothetical protein
MQIEQCWEDDPVINAPTIIVKQCQMPSGFWLDEHTRVRFELVPMMTMEIFLPGGKATEIPKDSGSWYD